MKTSEVHDNLSKLLVGKLQKYQKRRLDSTSCVEMYREIFDTLVEVMSQTGAKLTNESMNVLSQLYYDSVTVTDDSGRKQELDPNIFTKRASLRDIETRELTLLAMMFNGSPYSPLFIHEYKRRS